MTFNVVVAAGNERRYSRPAGGAHVPGCAQERPDRSCSTGAPVSAYVTDGERRQIVSDHLYTIT